MLWDIRAKMKPALSIIDLIPNIHRTPALANLRRAALEGRAGKVRLDAQDRELAFYDGSVQLTSPIGARLLQALYFEGRLKLKKPAQKSLPALEAYIAKEAEFRAEVVEILAQEAVRQARLEVILADPSQAVPEEITRQLIDKVVTARLGYGAHGVVEIAGIECHKELYVPPISPDDRLRPEGETRYWWLDASGQRKEG